VLIRRIVTDAHGAATYSASYASKADEPDSALMFNIITRAMGRMAEKDERPTTRDIFRILLNSVLSSSKVGATQVAYVLLGFKFVLRSREVKTVNALVRHLVAARVKELKQIMKSVEYDGAEASFLNTFSPGSNLGRRDVYSSFVKQQDSLQQEGGEGCTLTYANLLTFYDLTRHVERRSKKRPHAVASDGESDEEALGEDESNEGDCDETADRDAFDGASDEEGT